MAEEIQTSKFDSSAPSGRVHPLVRPLLLEDTTTRIRRMVRDSMAIKHQPEIYWHPSFDHCHLLRPRPNSHGTQVVLNELMALAQKMDVKVMVPGMELPARVFRDWPNEPALPEEGRNPTPTP